MSLFKMTFELLFTSKQNSRIFVANCIVFIHNLSIQELTCLPFKRCCKNIDPEIEFILIKQKQYDLDSFVRGYHTYMDIWKPKVGDENFCLKSENENQHVKFAVAIVLEERIVGHVPKNLSKIFHQFMKIPNRTIACKVTGKRVNRGAGYGLEIPVQYRFIGAEKAVKWAETNIKKVFENINKKVNKCVK